MKTENTPLRQFPDGSLDYGNGRIGPSLRDQEDANSGAMGPFKLDKKEIIKEAALVGGGTAFSLGVQSAAMALSFTTDILNPITSHHPNLVLTGAFVAAFPFRIFASKVDLEMIKKIDVSPNWSANFIHRLFSEPSRIRDWTTIIGSGFMTFDWFRIVSALHSQEVLTGVVSAQLVSPITNLARGSAEIGVIKALGRTKRKEEVEKNRHTDLRDAGVIFKAPKSVAVPSVAAGD